METVRLEIPYFFNAEYVPQGKRKPIEGVFGGTMEIQLASLLSEEAPLAVTVSGERITRPLQLRMWGDTCLDLARQEAGINDITPRHLDYYPDRLLAKFECGTLMEGPGDGRFTRIEGHYNLDHGMERVEQIKAEAARELSERFMFVDGRLHRKTALPVLHASIRYSFHTDCISIGLGTLAPEREDDLGAHGMRFPISDIEAALAWAERRKEIEGDAYVSQDVEIEVHDASVLPSAPILEHEAVRICKFILDKTDDLREQSDRFLSQWMVARRALRACEASLAEDDITAMIEAWKGLYAIYEVEEQARRAAYGSSYSIRGDIARKAFICLSESWENRPVAGFAATMQAAVPRY